MKLDILCLHSVHFKKAKTSLQIYGMVELLSSRQKVESATTLTSPLIVTNNNNLNSISETNVI